MRRIIYTAHARKRMRQRHVTRSMVRSTLSAPDHPYTHGRIADEEIAERRFGGRTIQVVFEERKTGEVIVITVKAIGRLGH
ncbi:MAG: DUF4258 domain-containing protein [bacterium]